MSEKTFLVSKEVFGDIEKEIEACEECAEKFFTPERRSIIFRLSDGQLLCVLGPPGENNT
jgi:hypothetical protein